ncbi:MAG: hypothetical protein ACXAD7_28845, partial [Candidatus Kariarchaeaceae archaeon]
VKEIVKFSYTSKNLKQALNMLDQTGLRYHFHIFDNQSEFEEFKNKKSLNIDFNQFDNYESSGKIYAKRSEIFVIKNGTETKEINAVLFSIFSSLQTYSWTGIANNTIENYLATFQDEVKRIDLEYMLSGKENIIKRILGKSNKELKQHLTKFQLINHNLSQDLLVLSNLLGFYDNRVVDIPINRVLKVQNLIFENYQIKNSYSTYKANEAKLIQLQDVINNNTSSAQLTLQEKQQDSMNLLLKIIGLATAIPAGITTGVVVWNLIQSVFGF